MRGFPEQSTVTNYCLLSDSTLLVTGAGPESFGKFSKVRALFPTPLTLPAGVGGNGVKTF